MFVLVLGVLLIVLASLVWYAHYRQMNYFKTKGFLHEKPHWLFGNCSGIGVTKHFLHIYKDYYEKFKHKTPVAGFYLFFKASVFVMDLDLVSRILIKDFQNFPSRGFYYNEERDPLSAHLFSINGDRWKKLRSKMTQAFTSGKMKIMFPAILNISNQYVQALTKSLDGKSPVDIKDWNIRYMTDVIGSLILGIDCRSLKDPKSEFKSRMAKLFLEKKITNPVEGFIMGYPEISRKFNVKITPKAIEDFIIQAISDALSYRRKNEVEYKDLLSILMNLKDESCLDENGNEIPSLTDIQIATQAHLFFFGGYESSSSVVSFTLYELSKNPSLQEKLRQEINSVMEEHGGDFTYEIMNEMSLLSMVLKETLRMYPLLHEISRVAVNDYKVPGMDLIIEAGTRIVIPLAAIHRDPDIYEDPDNYHPERFAPEEVKKRHPLAFLAFGEGPRNCIAYRLGLMQAKIGLVMLLRNFAFSSSDLSPKPINLNLQSYVVASADGIMLNVKAL